MLELFSHTAIWIFALSIVAVVVFQGITFIRITLKTLPSAGMTGEEAKSALKTGAISAIGPSLGIMIVAVSLITLIGDPLTLMRIGIIGSAPTESMGASLAADAFGAELGSQEFTEKAFTTVVWTLCLGGMGWLIVTALFTKSLGKIHHKASTKTSNPKLMSIVATAAMLGAFGYFSGSEMIKGMGHTIVIIASGITMVIILLIANKWKMNWLKEWSLGISILASLCVGYFLL
ncbi:DUF5058 family protein [Sediminibacillus massiliensis]|uniref:DUF5058 family protein n=1 Tax=Sediminibacillus massiliensis TaxID=1926277 RepID=UPI000988455E|nr:DUF5058 family protein [Sediminibacillus massiliensis]